MSAPEKDGMTAASLPALLPCPFCNAPMEQHPGYPDEYWHAYRLGERCPAGGAVIYLTDSKWVAAWNRRAGTAGLVEALEELLGRYTGASAKWGKSANEATIAKALAALAKHGGGT